MIILMMVVVVVWERIGEASDRLTREGASGLASGPLEEASDLAEAFLRPLVAFLMEVSFLKAFLQEEACHL